MITTKAAVARGTAAKARGKEVPRGREVARGREGE